MGYEKVNNNSEVFSLRNVKDGAKTGKPMWKTGLGKRRSMIGIGYVWDAIIFPRVYMSFDFRGEVQSEDSILELSVSSYI